MADIAPQNDEAVVIDLTGGGEATGATAPVLLSEDGAIPLIAEDGSQEPELPKRAIRNDDGSVTLPLRDPVVLQYRSAKGGEVREESFESLTMHRLHGKDLRAVMTASEASRAVVAAARSARINEAKFNHVYDRMDGADALDVLEVAGFFLERGQKTGR